MVVDVGFGSGVEALHRAGEIGLQLRRVCLPQIDRDLCQRQRLPLRAGRATHHHRVAEVRLVLNPVEVDPQRWRHPRVQDAVFDERHQRTRDQAGHLTLWRPLAVSGLLTLRNVIDMNDHRTGRLKTPGVIFLGNGKPKITPGVVTTDNGR
jgi:hypothetical protein